MNSTIILTAIIFFIVGAAISFLYAKSKANSSIIENEIKFQELQKQYDTLKNDFLEIKDDANFNMDQWQKEREKNTELSVRHQETMKAVEEQKSYMLETNGRLKEQFESLSAQVLKSNNEQFLDLAKTTLDKHFSDSKNDLEKTTSHRFIN